jgi:hypothetical protein
MKTIRRSSRSSVTIAGLAAGLLATASLAAAAQPGQADFDACNREAQIAQRGPTAPGGLPATPGEGSRARVTDSTVPGTQQGTGVTPSAAPPGSPANPTGGRITDSTQPGAAGAVTGSGAGSPGQQSELLRGMNPASQHVPGYQVAYLDCLKRRGF